MTREELRNHCIRTVELCELFAIDKGEKPKGKVYEEHKLILDILDTEPCEDCISREQARELMYSKQDALTEYDLDSLPSVTPARKRGKWIYPNVPAQYVDGQECSECGYSVYGVVDYKYCPNCGAKMEVDVEGSN